MTQQELRDYLDKFIETLRQQDRELRVRTGRTGADAFYEAIGFTRANGVAHCTHVLVLRQIAQPAGPNAHGDR